MTQRPLPAIRTAAIKLTSDVALLIFIAPAINEIDRFLRMWSQYKRIVIRQLEMFDSYMKKIIDILAIDTCKNGG